jgi:4-alpha-glucanotransferase
VTTHDLPTVAGLWDGSDLRLRRSLGLPADPAAAEELAGRAFAGMGSTTSVREVIDHVHRRIAASGCLVVTATLEDICAVRERPNQPGLLGPPSWSLALPLPLEAVESLEEARMVADSLARRSTTGSPAGSPGRGAMASHGRARPPL